MNFTANPTWRTSSYSGSQGSCVEVDDSVGDLTLVRDSKLGGESPILAFTPDQWRTFLVTLRDEGLA
jgi:hypothetical protein